MLITRNLDNTSGLSLASLKILDEVIKMGGVATRIKNTNITCIEKAKSKTLIVGNINSLIPYSIGLIMGSRYNIRELLKTKRIISAKGQLFSFNENDEALAFAKSIGYPVILQLENTQIDGTSIVNINNSKEFIKSFEDLSVYEANILVEKFIKGKIIRVLLTKSNYYNVVEKKYPCIVGNGKSKFIDLLSAENFNRLNSKDKLIQPIGVNKNFFKNSNLTINSIIPSRKKITIYTSTNAKNGVVFTDITNNVHPAILKLSKKILFAFPKLQYLSFEIITKNYKKNPGSNYVVGDLYLSPGPNINFDMVKGKSKSQPEKVFAELLLNYRK